MMHPLELHEIDISDEDTPRATHSSVPIVKVWTGSGWIVKMMHPHELSEIDFDDEDTPRSNPIVKVWTGSGWIDCDTIAPVKQEQVIYEEPEEDEEEPSITSKADKRRREKGTNFAYKQRTNLYIKYLDIKPGYNYPVTASIPHKLITATSAQKIVKPPRGDPVARIARSKAVLRRHDKTAFGPEEDYNFNTTHPRRHHTTWGNLGMIPPGNYYPEGRIDFWPRGATCKPVRRSFVDILNTW